MRLKYTLTALFISVTMLPLLLFWAWPHSAVLQDELKEVEERHLLLARNLGAALERYHRDLAATFRFIARALRHGDLIVADEILANLDFRHVCLFESATGRLISEASPDDARCPLQAPPARLAMLNEVAIAGGVRFSEVTAGPSGESVIYVVHTDGTTLAVGAFYTRYFVRLARQIAFGIKGHAAIVDHAGNVLAHPLASWIEARRNMADVSVVRRMLNGETGIETFLSPAFGGEMIAGFTTVRPVGWGVMIPQPVAELQAVADKAQRSALSVMAAGFLAAATIALAVSFWIARPLERMAALSRTMAEGHWPTPGPGPPGRLLPREFTDLQRAFDSMLRRLVESLSRSNHLAYVDGITNLANREFFKRVATATLDKPAMLAAGGSVVFLDLDGFKPVNDAYGHDVGDLLLAAVGGRLAASLEIMPLGARQLDDPLGTILGCLPQPVLARLGGDEFAVLLPSVVDEDDLGQIAEAILGVFHQPFDVRGHVIRLGASLGASRYPGDGKAWTQLVKKADTAMYTAKSRGRNRFILFDGRLLATDTDDSPPATAVEGQTPESQVGG